jgi:hypothetical protein
MERLAQTLFQKWNTTCLNTHSASQEIIVAGLKNARQLTAKGISVPKTWPNEEAYFLKIQAARIVLVSATPKGLHNGLVTLNQIFSRWRSLPPAEIRDWPAFPLRTAYIYTRGALTDSAKARLLQFVDLKYNQLVLPTLSYFHLDKPKERDRAQAYFNFLRKFHVEPVPYIALPGSEDWNEAVFLQDEPIVFHGDSAKIEVRHLLNLPDTRPSLTSARAADSSRIVFEEGKDYTIASQNPPVFRRLLGSRIANGDTVFFSGDIYDPREARYHKPCPSEPLVYAKQSEAIRATVQLLHPKTIHIGHDEVGLVNADSRCKRRHMPGYELFAEQLNRAFQNVKEVNPNIDVQLWSDSINPYHNAADIHLEKTADLLTRQFIVDHWFYDVNSARERDLMQKGMAFFLQRGFRIVVCPWEHLTNHQYWEELLRTYAPGNPGVLGVMHTEWNDKDWGKVPTAMIGWCGQTWLTK